MIHRLAAIGIAIIAAPAWAGVAPKADPKPNPAPRMRYEFTVKVDGAPGPFDRIEGVVDYRVANEACVPLAPVVGATVAPEKRVPVVLKAADPGLYKGEIFTDFLQDEDYFGKGVCHWSIVAASANLYVKQVDFSAPLFKDKLFSATAVTRWYANRSYAMTDMERVDTGEENRSQYGDEANATFSVTVQAVKP